MKFQCVDKRCFDEATHAVEFWTITNNLCERCTIEFTTAVVLNGGSVTIVVID